MAIVYGNHIPAHEWRKCAYETWAYEIPMRDYLRNDVLRVGYSSAINGWVVFINQHEMGQAPTLEEGKALAVLLYKLHPDLHGGSGDFRMPNFK